ncbi:MAG: type I secretion system permease/ATPase [Methylotenera sp.]
MKYLNKHLLPAEQTLKKALLALWPAYRNVFLFGFFTNVMLLAPSWYMLEVYSRVINSRNITTLVMLTLLVTFIYLIMEAVEWVRRKILHTAATEVEQVLQQKLFEAAFAAKLKNAQFSSQQVFADFATVKSSLYSSALLGLIDLPFAAIFLLVIFLIHPALGLLTTLGLVIQVTITLANQWRINPQMKEANQHAIEAQRYFTSVSHKADVVQAMGMLAPIEKKWLVAQQAFLLKQAQASELAGKSAASSKFLQTLQSSLILGLACYLVISGKLPNGGAMMIIASILAARVLAPLVQLVSQWKTLAQAKEAYLRLEPLLQTFSASKSGMDLPPPTGEISVENLSYALPNLGKTPNEVFLKNIGFKLNKGDVLVIAGPSASGKTTLSKLLAGLAAPTSGKVRYNGVDAYAWDKNALGQHIGYMSQEVELMDGTVAENIVRFGEQDETKLAEAIDLLGLQELINKLPHGLASQIGSDGAFLSGGQRQLIGLARAVYGAPKIVILDEPNANLDQAGEKHLQQMITKLKQQGTTFVVISHLQHIVGIADYLLVMMQGQVLRFGKPTEVMNSLQAIQMSEPNAKAVKA